MTARVNYFEKQFLRVDEFRDEQLYQLSLRRRHNNTQHTWGIVHGLAIATEEGATVVQPGFAIDGYGRELLLPAKLRVAKELFDDLGSDRLDLWLAYRRQDDGAAPEGYGECGQSSGGSYRSTEIPEVIIDRPQSNTVDPRKPPGVANDVLQAAVPPLSDDPRDVWPVYLGRLIRLENGSISIDLSRRPYAGVVAETIDHPANAARVEIGRDTTAEHTRTIGDVTYTYKRTENEVRRFAVFVPEDLGQQQPAASQVELSPRVEILGDGTIGLAGRTVVQGNLRISGGAVQFVDAAKFTEDTAPQQPSMYRFAEDGKDELRIDLGADATGTRRFVIGFSSPDGKFTPCVTVALDGNGTPVVTVHGHLKVDGKLLGQILPVLVSPEAMAAIRGSFQAGLAAGNVPA